MVSSPEAFGAIANHCVLIFPGHRPHHWPHSVHLEIILYPSYTVQPGLYLPHTIHRFSVSCFLLATPTSGTQAIEPHIPSPVIPFHMCGMFSTLNRGRERKEQLIASCLVSQSLTGILNVVHLRRQNRT